MGALFSPASDPNLLPPPPPTPELLEHCDRFGWPLYSCLLRDSAATRLIKREMIIELVTDAFRAAERELGRAEAKRLFHEVTKDRNRGKQPSKPRQRLIQQGYDELVLEMPDEIDRIPAILGKRLYDSDKSAFHSKVAATRAVYRYLQQKNAQDQQRELQEKLFPPSLIGQAKASNLKRRSIKREQRDI